MSQILGDLGGKIPVGPRLQQSQIKNDAGIDKSFLDMLNERINTSLKSVDENLPYSPDDLF